MFSPGLSGKHAENASAAANIEHHFVLENVPVQEDGILVGASSNFVLQHLLVNAMVSVRVKVVVLRSHVRSSHIVGRHQFFAATIGAGQLWGFGVADAFEVETQTSSKH